MHANGSGGVTCIWPTTNLVSQTEPIEDKMPALEKAQRRICGKSCPSLWHLIVVLHCTSLFVHRSHQIDTQIWRTPYSSIFLRKRIRDSSSRKYILSHVWSNLRLESRLRYHLRFFPSSVHTVNWDDTSKVFLYQSKDAFSLNHGKDIINQQTSAEIWNVRSMYALQYLGERCKIE